MAEKRAREDDGDAPQEKKRRSGFKVGPDNLPDGTWKRKVLKIKKDLVQKAKIKKEYAKVKAREPPVDKPIPNEAPEDENPATEEPQVQMHPDRQALREASEDPTSPQQPRRSMHGRRPKIFEKEMGIAAKQKAEAEARREAFRKAQEERASKIAQRQKFRREMGKARGGPDGKRKLGRESKILLERVKKIVGE